jgi:hypothetical protein
VAKHFFASFFRFMSKKQFVQNYVRSESDCFQLGSSRLRSWQANHR